MTHPLSLPASATPPHVEVGMKVLGIWGQGCGESEGFVLNVIGVDSPNPKIQWIDTKGHITTSKVKWKGDGELSPIGVYVYSDPVDPTWQWQVNAINQAKDERTAKESAEKEHLCIKSIVQVEIWQKECTNITVSGSHTTGIDKSGALCLWLTSGLQTSRFAIGDSCRVGSYNFDYIGKVTRVTPKTIWTEEHGKAHRFTHAQFCSLNMGWTLAKGVKTREEWSD